MNSLETRTVMPLNASPLWRAIRRRLIYLAVVIPALTAIYYMSFWIRYEGQFDAANWALFTLTLPWFVVVKLLLFSWFRIPRNWGRYVTFYDLIAMVEATTVSLLLLGLVNRFLCIGPVVPRSIYVLDWGATIMFIGGARATLRAVRERNWRSLLWPDHAIHALIVGANDAGELLLRAIRSNLSLPYHVVGFLSNDPHTIGTAIGGVPVMGTVDQVGEIADRHQVGEVLIVADELPGRQLREVVEDARRRSIQVKVVPGYEQLISGQMAVQPRAVSIQDLLHRDPVHLDLEDIRQWIDHRVLLVTGSAGSIGSEVCRQLLQFSPRRLVMVDRAESGQFFLDREVRSLAGETELDVHVADVLDEPHMRRILHQCRPDVIFHAAAYKHVPLMEAQPNEAVKNIVLATRRVADLDMEYGVGSFVMISTDKAVNPTSVMGACKRAAELYVQAQAAASKCRFVTVRFGNVLASAGSVVPVFREQIRRGGPVTVTDPRIERFFMTIPEAARLVIQAGAIGRSGEILLLDMGEPVRIVDLATDMIRLSGLEVGRDIEIQFTGLRPGEKLYEELHLGVETPMPTRHPKITIVDRARRDPTLVISMVNNLIDNADGQADALVETLEDLVPTYGETRRAAQRYRAAA